MSRLPIRLRLTLAFALAMAVVLSAVGAFLYVRLGDSLEEQLDESLQARAAALAALVRARGDEIDGAELSSGEEEGFGQLISQDGAVLASAPEIGSGALISPREAARARDESFIVEREAVPGTDGSAARVLVTPVESEGKSLALVVGAPLEDRDEALAGLLAQLLVIGPVALVIASLAGYFLAAAALRPVKAMSRRAAEISSDGSGQRLPLSEARDEIRHLGETLNQMLARLEAGLARERRFVADASHELRTPLALLQTELELALRRPRLPEEHERALRSAAEEVDRLVLLAEDLLVLARADEGRLPLRLEPIPPADLLHSVARRFEARAESAGRSIVVAGGTGLAIAGDRARLEQALGNLVDNGLRHGAGTIRLEAEHANGGVDLRVSDAGAGFPPDLLPRAFERFSRADEAREGSAAGLGLAIVDAIARAHGGFAVAANGNGGGAVVALRLPTAAAGDSAPPAPGPPSTRTAEIGPRS
jgi:heavy metal sensor kinase